MVSFIIAGSDKTKRQKYIRQFCLDHSINPIDITTIEKETAIKQNANTIGIEEIKNMQKKLFLKPIKSKTKAIILEDAQLLTTIAQNALLKSLEEPPANTIIILSSHSQETLLPTIISRCQIIQLKDKTNTPSEKQTNEITEFLRLLPEMPISEKLKKAESLSKDKQKAKTWIETLIHILREKLLQSPNDTQTLYTLTNLQKTHTLLATTNTNPRFALEIAILDIPDNIK